MQRLIVILCIQFVSELYYIAVLAHHLFVEGEGL